MNAALAAPLRPAPVSRWRSRWQQLPLAFQVALAGGAAYAATLVLRTAGTDALPPLHWADLLGLPVLAAAAWPAHRAGQALLRLAEGARALVREGADADAQLDPESACTELRAASTALRRAVEQLHRRRRALQAQVEALGVQLHTRTQALTSLQDLSIGLASRGEVTGLVDEALGALGSAMSYSSASVWSRVGLEPQQPVVLTGYRSDAADLAGLALTDLQGLRLSRANLAHYEQVEREGQPIVRNRPRHGLLSWLWAMVTDDARTSGLYRHTRAWMAVPLKVQERVLGVLRVDHHQADYFDAERSRLLSAVAGQTALAMSHANALALQRDAAVAAERNRIARELHDAVSQTLFAANLLAAALVRAAGDDAALRGQAQVLERLNRSALAEMRMMLFELRPDALGGVRLTELLQQVAEALSGRGGVEIDLHVDEQHPVPQDVRMGVYRIAQAALSNIGRHSGATHVRLHWRTPQPGSGRLEVSDDGCGFDGDAEHPGHFGLHNMRERAAALGGQLRLRTSPGQGTDIVLDVPWS